MYLFNAKIVVPPIASNHLKPIAVFLRARSYGPTLSLHIFDPSLPNLTFLSFPFLSFLPSLPYPVLLTTSPVLLTTHV